MIHLMGFEEAPREIAGLPVVPCLSLDSHERDVKATTFHVCRPAWFVPGFICVSCGKRSGFFGCLEPEA